MQLCLSKRNNVIKWGLKKRFQGQKLLPSHIGERGAMHPVVYGHTNVFHFNPEFAT